MHRHLALRALFPLVVVAVAACGSATENDLAGPPSSPASGGATGAQGGGAGASGATSSNGGGLGIAGHSGASAGMTQSGSSGGAAGASGGSSSGGNGGSAGGTATGGTSGSGAGGNAATGGSSASGGTSGGPGGGAGGAKGGGSGQGGTPASGGTTGTGGSSDCSAASELVYVFSLDNEIWSFDPPNKKFTKVATPDCPTGGMQANSMAIDRNLVAWLNYIDGFGGGGLYTFDLNTKSGCKQSPVNLPSGFGQVGMGFSTDTVGGTTETLYVDGIGGGGLAKVDMSTHQVIPIGNFGNDPALSGQSAELTGTGDARLFGYFTTSPEVRVAELDKTNGNALSDYALPGVSPPSDWAFSFWGGDFYLYAAPGNNGSGNSSVIHYDPKNKTVDQTYVADVGFTIIGAGVSTCAPTTKP